MSSNDLPMTSPWRRFVDETTRSTFTDVVLDSWRRSGVKVTSFDDDLLGMSADSEWRVNPNEALLYSRLSKGASNFLRVSMRPGYGSLGLFKSHDELWLLGDQLECSVEGRVNYGLSVSDREALGGAFQCRVDSSRFRIDFPPYNYQYLLLDW